MKGNRKETIAFFLLSWLLPSSFLVAVFLPSHVPGNHHHGRGVRGRKVKKKGLRTPESLNYSLIFIQDLKLEALGECHPPWTQVRAANPFQVYVCIQKAPTSFSWFHLLNIP